MFNISVLSTPSLTSLRLTIILDYVNDMKTFSVASVALLVSPFLVAVTATPLRCRSTGSNAYPCFRVDTDSSAADAAEIGDNEKRADCWIKADWYGNWPSGGFRRYGVRLTAGPDGRRKDLLDLFCAITQGTTICFKKT